MELQIFKRPQDSPAATEADTDIRINYNDQWIDFRNGEVIVTKEGEPGNTADEKTQCCYCGVHQNERHHDKCQFGAGVFRR